MVFPTQIFSQTTPKLNEEEVKKSKTVKFINRSNKKASTEKADSDSNLGKRLAELSQKSRKWESGGVEMERFLPGAEKSGGDLIFLTPSFPVGHINTLSRILTSYVEHAFSYPSDEAKTISFYILNYNAIHRSDINYLSSRYIPDLLKSVEKDRIGLSKNYKEWSGKTQILIPLVSQNEDHSVDISLKELESSVNPNLLEEEMQYKSAMEKIRETRKTVVDPHQKKENIESPTEPGDLNPRKPNKPKIVLEELNPGTSVDNFTEKDTKEKTPEPTKKPESVPPEVKIEKKTEVEMVRAPVTNSVNEMEKTKSEVQASHRSREEIEKNLEKKEQEIVDLKNQIQNREKKSENLIEGKVVFLQVVKNESEGHFTNDLYLLDPNVEEGGLYKSPYENICGKDFKILEDGILVIGFEGKEVDNTIHHLVLLDKSTLKVKKMSREKIFWKSEIYLKEGKIYTFELGENDQLYLSRFNQKLERESRSSVPVFMYSNLTFNDSRVILTSKLQNQNASQVILLNKEDLQLIKSYQPNKKPQKVNP